MGNERSKEPWKLKSRTLQNKNLRNGKIILKNKTVTKSKLFP